MRVNEAFVGTRLSELPIKERLSRCPPFLRELVSEAQHQLSLQKVILFGSRARGDARPRSDYDLCFVTIDPPGEKWDRFRGWVDEHARTLLHIDLVHWDAASSDLRDSIEHSGIIIHEQN